MDILQGLLQNKLVAILRQIQREQMLPLLAALLEGGISCAEITFDHTSTAGMENTLACIRAASEAYGERLWLGAGTVLTESEAENAVEAGARFLISPNTDRRVIGRTKALGAVSIPGALTPSEAVEAFAAGADIVKLFPAGVFGAGYIKALRAPLAHIPMMAVGGITPQNQSEFLAAGACCLGVGGNLVSPAYLRKNRFDLITEAAKAYTSQL